MPSLRRIGIAVAVTAALIAVPTIASALIIDLPFEATHTGCSKANGTIDRVATGDAPKSACDADGEKEIHLSGGDITAVNTAPTSGIQGGGLTGPVNLSLKKGYKLPQLCVGQQVPKPAPGGAWKCAYDVGTVAKNLGPLTIDAQGPTDVCRDYSAFTGTSGDKTKQTTKVSLPAGQYRPLPTGAFRWFVNRTAAAGDGETFTGGYVKAEIIRVEIFGAESVASTWARAVDEHNDGAGLPYNQDFSTFSADGNATFYLKLTARADACSRARLLDAAIELERVN